MDVKSCYEKMGGNYEEVKSRLPMDAMIAKFAKRLIDDQSYPNLVKAMKDEDYELAFRSSHSLKGICQNLGFTKLYESSAELTERLRNGKDGDTTALEARVAADYEFTIQIIQEMEA